MRERGRKYEREERRKIEVIRRERGGEGGRETDKQRERQRERGERERERERERESKRVREIGGVRYLTIK